MLVWNVAPSTLKSESRNLCVRKVSRLLFLITVTYLDDKYHLVLQYVESDTVSTLA